MSTERSRDRAKEQQTPVMEFAEIPGTGLRVSRISLGTWAIGGWLWGGTNEAESIATIRTALAHGINVIDTAPVYGFGRSEEIVGKALADGLRQHVILATKVGLQWQDGKITRNASRERIVREIDDFMPAAADRPHRHLSSALARPQGPHGGDRQGHARALRSRDDSRHRRQQFLGRADGRVPALAPCGMSGSRLTICSSVPSTATSCLIAASTALPRSAMARSAAACCPAMRADTKFEGDDLRLRDPKFQPPRFAQYLAAVERLDRFGQQRYGQARHRPRGAPWSRPGHHHGALGCAPSRSARSGRSGHGLVARRRRQARDRPHSGRSHHRPGGS